MGKVELLGRKRHLRDCEITVVRIDVPGVLERVEVDAVAVLAEVFVLDMAGIEAGHGLDHLKGVAVHVRAAHSEAVHIMHHRAFPEADEFFRVRQRVDGNGQNAAGIRARLHLGSDVRAFPLIPVRDMGKLRLPFVGGELAELGHRPALAAAFAEDLRPLRAHAEFRPAVRALIQHLVQALRPSLVGRADALFLLPGEIVVLKGLDDAAVELVRARDGELLRRKEQLELRLRRLHAAVVQIPERRIDVVTVADERHDRRLQ